MPKKDWWFAGTHSIFSNRKGDISKLARKAKKDKTGRKTAQLWKINDLLGFTRGKK